MENCQLRQKVGELELELSRLRSIADVEYIRAAAAERVMTENSAILKLYQKRKRELNAWKNELASKTQLLSRAESELMASQKMESIGRLAAGVTHEINSPIQFVSDSLFFLEQGLQDLFDMIDQIAEAAKEKGASDPVDHALVAADYQYLKEQLPLSVARAEDGISRVADIVRAMKTFSHPDRTTMKSADINAGIESTLAICKNEYKYVANLETNFGELPLVDCVAGEVNQVVLNLVVNAAHAIEDKFSVDGQRGTIRIRTYASDDQARIEISDTGTGIPEAVQAKIFTPFFTTKVAGKGTGQGLSLAHHIVCEMHHGTINFETQPGVGTKFTISLPIRQTGGQSSEHAEAA